MAIDVAEGHWSPLMAGLVVWIGPETVDRLVVFPAAGELTL